MTTNEPEIVTNRQVKMLKDDYDYWPESEKREVINTIELFAGLLEEKCEVSVVAGKYLGEELFEPCGHNRNLCQPCLRKAAALRRYRGE